MEKAVKSGQVVNINEALEEKLNLLRDDLSRVTKEIGEIEEQWGAEHSPEAVIKKPVASEDMEKAFRNFVLGCKDIYRALEFCHDRLFSEVSQPDENEWIIMMAREFIEINLSCFGQLIEDAKLALGNET